MMKKNFCPFCGKKLITKFVEGGNRLFCKSCDTPIYENPVPATAIVAVDSKKRLLLVKRSVPPKTGMWCLPGGFLELGESPEQGALRELKEETGLSGTIQSLLGVISSNSPRYNTVLLVGYLVNNYTGTLIAGDDASDASYFSPEELPKIAFSSHKDFINMYYSSF